MFVPPASVIVTWPRPNYVNPVSRAPIVYALDAVFLFVATVAVSIRLYTRIAIRKWVGIDDFFIVLAWLLNVGVIFIVFYASSHYDWNKHLWDVRLSHIQPATKSLFWLAIVWACSSAAIRLSLLFFFYRLLTHFEIRKYRWVLHCNVFFVIAIWAALVCSTVFNDNPIRAYWTFPLITSAKQDLERYSFTILSSLNTFSELLIAVLPLPVVFGKLNILPVQRWGTAVLLSLGILVAVVGGIRTFYAWKFFTEYDHSWVATPYLICSEIELDTALICACIPALLPFYARMTGCWSKLVTSKSKELWSSTTAAQSTSYADRSEYSGNFDPNMKQGDLSLWTPWAKTFDLEGIDTEGFGYRVTVTAGPQESDTPRRGWRMKRSPADTDADFAERGDRWLGGVRKPRPAQTRAPGHDRNRWDTLKVHTAHSVEVRESHP